MIHQTLYESRDFTFVDFHSFLDRIVPSLVSAYGVNPRRITLSIRADKVSLPIQAAIPCGLIVNELVANALKHAFPGDARGRIDVELDRDAEGKIVLSVSDDGVGMPDGVDLANAATLGLQLVALLADQLGGALVVNPARPTRFCVRFPEAS
jgi:two-component sensor histidine kinase